MGRFYWKSKKTLTILAFAFITYFLVKKENYEHKTSFKIPKGKPQVVWEYVSDFSHMKYLNPTIQDFKILSDSWSNGHWSYSVEYSEKLSHWPYSPNVAVAHYTIIRDEKSDKYKIESTHTTCLFNGLYCLQSIGIFKFYTVDKQTTCDEDIQYECPRLMTYFCKREVQYQRQKIETNLKNIFSK